MIVPFEKLYIDEECWLGRYFDPSYKVWILGTEITKWSLSSYKKYISIFANIITNYPENYISLVKTEKEKKFNMLFGFKETGILVNTEYGEYEILCLN